MLVAVICTNALSKKIEHSNSLYTFGLSIKKKNIEEDRTTIEINSAYPVIVPCSAVLNSYSPNGVQIIQLLPG